MWCVFVKTGDFWGVDGDGDGDGWAGDGGGGDGAVAGWQFMHIA